jgi:hypothetical protein
VSLGERSEDRSWKTSSATYTTKYAVLLCGRKAVSDCTTASFAPVPLPQPVHCATKKVPYLQGPSTVVGLLVNVVRDGALLLLAGDWHSLCRSLSMRHPTVSNNHGDN